MTGMILMYGRAFRNGLEVRRLYGKGFPSWNLPDHRPFNAIVQRLRKNGWFRWRTSDLGLPKNQPNTKCEIRNFKYRRRKSRHKRAKIGLACTILKPDDFRKRVAFLEWLLQEKRGKSTLYWKIIFNRWANIYQRRYFQFPQHPCLVRRESPRNSRNALSGSL